MQSQTPSLASLLPLCRLKLKRHDLIFQCSACSEDLWGSPQGNHRCLFSDLPSSDPNRWRTHRSFKVDCLQASTSDHHSLPCAVEAIEHVALACQLYSDLWREAQLRSPNEGRMPDAPASSSMPCSASQHNPSLSFRLPDTRVEGWQEKHAAWIYTLLS